MNSRCPLLIHENLTLSFWLFASFCISLEFKFDGEKKIANAQREVLFMIFVGGFMNAIWVLP